MTEFSVCHRRGLFAMYFDWITWSIWLIGLIILVVWIVIPYREFRRLLADRKKSAG